MKSFTTYAERFCAIVTQLPTWEDILVVKEDNGNGWPVWANDFVKAWRALAVEVTYPLGTNSLDPTERWVFPDGSVVRVGNPWQVFYCLHAMEE